MSRPIAERRPLATTLTALSVMVGASMVSALELVPAGIPLIVGLLAVLTLAVQRRARMTAIQAGAGLAFALMGLVGLGLTLGGTVPESMPAYLASNFDALLYGGMFAGGILFAFEVVLMHVLVRALGAAHIAYLEVWKGLDIAVCERCGATEEASRMFCSECDGLLDEVDHYQPADSEVNG